MVRTSPLFKEDKAFGIKAQKQLDVLVLCGFFVVCLFFVFFFFFHPQCGSPCAGQGQECACLKCSSYPSHFTPCPHLLHSGHSGTCSQNNCSCYVSVGDAIFSSFVSFKSQELNCKQNDSYYSEILLMQEDKNQRKDDNRGRMGEKDVRFCK